jgi:hypothetical protein
MLEQMTRAEMYLVRHAWVLKKCPMLFVGFPENTYFCNPERGETPQ